jgi:enamine deaminase RidA (YjgF/YER057c/UK114 family)
VFDILPTLVGAQAEGTRAGQYGTPFAANEGEIKGADAADDLRQRPRSAHSGRHRSRRMAMNGIEHQLNALGIVLPTPAAPVANYVPYTFSGQLLFISGQVCFGVDGKLAPEHVGKVGGAVSPEAGAAAARSCAIQVLAQAKAALGDLTRIERCVRLGGFINAQPDFGALPAIMNGASDLMVAVFGDRGRHARTTVGVAALPLNCAVEVEAVFEFR